MLNTKEIKAEFDEYLQERNRLEDIDIAKTIAQRVHSNAITLPIESLVKSLKQRMDDIPDIQRQDYEADPLGSKRDEREFQIYKEERLNGKSKEEVLLEMYEYIHNDR